MSPFDYITWKRPPSKEAVVAIAWFYVNEEKYVAMLKDSEELVADMLKVESPNAAAFGVDLERAKHLARVVRTEQSAKAALDFIESIESRHNRPGAAS